MKKEGLIKLAERFMQIAFQANCYNNIVIQYSENIKEYHQEMSYSSAFYSYTYNALVVATFMELAKIYDNHKQSINLKQLMYICKEHISIFPQHREYKMFVNDKDIIKKLPYCHMVSSEEEEFFQKEVESQKPFLEFFGVPNQHVRVKMTIKRYFELYEWKYKKIEIKINNLLKQRNKVYAHNDKKAFSNIEEVISSFPLNRDDIEALVFFALDFCQFVVAVLTSIYKTAKPVNINDWKATLELVRLGNKYKDVEIDMRMKEFIYMHLPETND